MSYIESNVFPISNIRDLKAQYRLYRIRGLSIDQDEYDQNIQIIIQQLSYKFHSPVTVVMRNNEPHLVLRNDAVEPSSPHVLVRATAYFDKTLDVLALDYEKPTSETLDICLRFLQFGVHGSLRANASLWSPGAGRPFFYRTPAYQKNGVNVFLGFSIRIVHTQEGVFGVCVDAKHRYVSQQPISAKITKEDFRRIRGAHCVYHFGQSWYEIQLHEHSGLTVDEQKIALPSGGHISLLDYVSKNAPKPLPKEVANITRDCAALLYLTSQKQLHAVPAVLCYTAFETNDSRIRQLHRETILPPRVRRTDIHGFVDRYLQSIPLDGTKLMIELRPLEVKKSHLQPPDVLFGNKTILSVRGTSGCVHVDLQELGKARLSSLLDARRGPYTVTPLERQYLIWPESVASSYGPAFLQDLKQAIVSIYPQAPQYAPILVSYNDRDARTFCAQGRAVLSAVDGANHEPGYGLVMIHETVDRRTKQHDQLAAMVMRELRKRNIYASVVHIPSSEQYYDLISTDKGVSAYRQTTDQAGQRKLRGYLRNVALNKILLTNEKWPFVLNTPLHADLTIGIDVQLNTTCFTFFGSNGPDIRTICKDSNQKERLGRNQVRTILLDILRQEATMGRKPVTSIAVHRDGRLFRSEIIGLTDAVDILKKEGIVSQNASLNFVEISKTSLASIRLFDVSDFKDGTPVVDNPQVGTFWQLSANDAYLMTTGRAFQHPGTSNPLHIRYVSGSMSFTHIIEDIYSLSCLTWTRPEDCSREPITIKLADIRLREHAGGYDEDALEYDDNSQGVEIP